MIQDIMIDIPAREAGDNQAGIWNLESGIWNLESGTWNRAQSLGGCRKRSCCRRSGCSFSGIGYRVSTKNHQAQTLPLIIPAIGWLALEVAADVLADASFSNCQ